MGSLKVAQMCFIRALFAEAACFVTCVRCFLEFCEDIFFFQPSVLVSQLLDIGKPFKEFFLFRLLYIVTTVFFLLKLESTSIFCYNITLLNRLQYFSC